VAAVVAVVVAMALAEYRVQVEPVETEMVMAETEAIHKHRAV
jgi:hypothetical protein